MAALPYAPIRTVVVRLDSTYLLTIVVYPKGVGVTAEPRARLLRDLKVSIAVVVIWLLVPLLLPDVRTAEMHKYKEKEKRKSMHFFLRLLLYIYPTTFTDFIRDLKRGKEVLNNKKVSIITTIPEGIFISLFLYKLTRFLSLVFPRSRNRSRVRPRYSSRKSRRPFTVQLPITHAHKYLP